MDKINILAKKMDTLDCYKNNIIFTLCNYYNIDYRPIFLANFNFCFEASPDLDTDHIYIYGGNSKCECSILKDLCGINRKSIENLTYKEFILTIQQEIEMGRPIGIRINSFHLKWNKFYHQLNRNHYILIIGIDINSGTLSCCDGYLSEEIQVTKIDDIFNHYDFLLTFSKTEIKHYNKLDLYKYFENVINENSDNRLEDIISFSNHITKCKYPCDSEWNQDYIQTSLFFFRFSQICWSRENFIKGIQYLINHEVYGLSCLLPNLKLISKEWYKARGLYMKSIIAKNPDYIVEVSRLIENIAYMENDMVQTLGEINKEDLFIEK